MKKNVIVLMIDGGRLDRVKQSKYFNKLNDKAVFFSQPITYGPHTIAAMHAFFSGSYGTRTGTNSYWSTYKFKKNQFKTLTEYLKDADYYTHADIVNKIVIPKQGFDEFNVHDEQKDNLTTRHCEILNHLNKHSENKKFFVFLQYSNIHTGIMNQVLKVYNNFSKEFFDNPSLNKKRYDDLFHDAEVYLEKILEKIHELSLEKDSIILIMSDHGMSVGEKFGERAYGAFCYDYTLRTFAYFLTPDFPSRSINQQVRTIDFMPTLLDFLDLDTDSNFEKLDGESLLPLIKGDDLAEKIAYAETGNPLQGKEPPKKPNIRCVRLSEWKLILNEHNNTRELYHLVNDPDENENLSGTGLEIEDRLFEKLETIKNGERLYK